MSFYHMVSFFNAFMIVSIKLKYKFNCPCMCTIVMANVYGPDGQVLHFSVLMLLPLSCQLQNTGEFKIPIPDDKV